MASSARREELMKERNKGEDLGWKGRRELLISRVALHKMHVGRMHSAAAAAAMWCWQRVGRCVLAEQSTKPGLRISCAGITGELIQGSNAGSKRWDGTMGRSWKSSKRRAIFSQLCPPPSEFRDEEASRREGETSSREPRQTKEEDL